MKFYIAELVATGIAFLCALTNHAGACFVWRKLMPLDLWASNVIDARGVNQLHRFQAPEGVTEPTCPCEKPWITFTGAGLGATGVYRICPKHGAVCIP